jgi:hypothetical protein
MSFVKKLRKREAPQVGAFLVTGYNYSVNSLVWLLL